MKNIPLSHSNSCSTGQQRRADSGSDIHFIRLIIQEPFIQHVSLKDLQRKTDVGIESDGRII